MSFRELRNFTETMKALGYPRLISVENFRTPNFELVADALYWLVHRYDPTAEIDENISSENHRVEFLKAVATCMMAKARVKLNIKQLYRADGYAVKELLKISSLLYDAIQLDSGVGSDNGPQDDKSQAQADLSLAQKLEELKEARNAATEIVESGSKLYGLLGRENELREARDRAMTFLDSISNNLGSDDPHQQIERSIREQVSLLTDNVQELEHLRDEAEKSSKTLKQKIERKHTELERAEKRLKSLKKVKPAFSEEYEQLEHELKGIYNTYLERFRNLQYLEFELNKYHAAEMEKKVESDKALKRMQKRLREEELRILRGDQPVDENAIDRDDDVWDSGKDDDSGDGESSDSDRGGRGGRGGSSKQRHGASMRPSAGRPGQGGGRANVVGSLAGADSDDDDDDSDASDDDDSTGGGGHHGGGRGGKSDSDGSDLSDDDDLDGSEDDPRKGNAAARGGGGERDRGFSKGGAPGGPGGSSKPLQKAGNGGGGGGGRGRPQPDEDDSEEPSDEDDSDDGERDDEAF